MNTSNPHQLTQQTTPDATVEISTVQAQRRAQHEQGRPKRFLGIYLPSRPLREAAQEVRHLHQLERAGETEWTPWIALAGLILFLMAIGLLMFGIVDAASDLLASASPKGLESAVLPACGSPRTRRARLYPRAPSSSRSTVSQSWSRPHGGRPPGD